MWKTIQNLFSSNSSTPENPFMKLDHSMDSSSEKKSSNGVSPVSFQLEQREFIEPVNSANESEPIESSETAEDLSRGSEASEDHPQTETSGPSISQGPLIFVKQRYDQLQQLDELAQEYSRIYGDPLLILGQHSLSRKQWIECYDDESMIETNFYEEVDVIFDCGFHLIDSPKVIEEWKVLLGHCQKFYRAVICVVPEEIEPTIRALTFQETASEAPKIHSPENRELETSTVSQEV